MIRDKINYLKTMINNCDEQTMMSTGDEKSQLFTSILLVIHEILEDIEFVVSDLEGE